MNPAADHSAVIKEQVIAALSSIFDPEIPVNIYDLGLVYDVAVTSDNVVGIRMTLTAPGCPAAESLPGEVKRQVSAVSGVAEVTLEIVWDPPWDRDRISMAAKLQLGIL